MFKFFDTIIDIISTIINFVINLFEMIGYMLGFIVQGVAWLTASVAYLPAWVLPFVTAVIAFSVIMFIINR